jgi:hypothetical protein
VASIAGIEDLGSGAPGHGDDASAHGRLAACGAGRKLDREAEPRADPLLESVDVVNGDGERRRFRGHVPAMLGDGIHEDGRLAQPAAGEMNEQDEHGDHAQRTADNGGKESAAPPRRAPAQYRCRLACDVLLDPGPQEVRRRLGQGPGGQQRVKPHLRRLGCPAGLAVAQVMLETDRVRHAKLAVEESRDELDRLSAAHRRTPDRSASPAHSAARRSRRARHNRDITVPTGTPRIPATSR